jgi:hypothetical protein
MNDFVSQITMLWNYVLSDWVKGCSQENTPTYNAMKWSNLMTYSNQLQARGWIASSQWWIAKNLHEEAMSMHIWRAIAELCDGHFHIFTSWLSLRGNSALNGLRQPWRSQNFHDSWKQESTEHSIPGIKCSLLESIFLWVIGDRPGFPLFAPVTILSGVKLQTAFASQVLSRSEGQPEERVHYCKRRMRGHFCTCPIFSYCDICLAISLTSL